MSDVRCTGNERSLTECHQSGWGKQNREHSKDAGVVCAPLGKVTTFSDRFRYNDRENYRLSHKFILGVQKFSGIRLVGKYFLTREEKSRISKRPVM